MLLVVNVAVVTGVDAVSLLSRSVGWLFGWLLEFGRVGLAWLGYRRRQQPTTTATAAPTAATATTAAATTKTVGWLVGSLVLWNFTVAAIDDRANDAFFF